MGKPLSLGSVMQQFGKDQLVYTAENRPPKKPPQTAKPPKKLQQRRSRGRTFFLVSIAHD
jgi:hypothetical protein